jgi:TolB protein
VAFTSDAADLVADDANGRLDVFVRDRRTGATERVSLGTGGAEGDGDSFEPAISADGRFVAFTSRADDLVAGDTNGLPDTFVRDRQAGATRRVNVGPGGAQADAFTFAPAISGDGRFVAFQSEAATLVAGDTNGAADVFVRDQRAGATERVSVSSGEAQGDGPSGQPSISADGRRVAFTTRATNLVPGDASPRDDVLVRDRRAGTTRRVNVRSGGGGQANGVSSQPAISADGRVVAFLSSATNLVRGDTNRAADVFVRDLATGGATRRASVTSAGGQADGGSSNPAVSGDGRSVAFDSTAANLVAGDSNGAADVFVRTR